MKKAEWTRRKILNISGRLGQAALGGMFPFRIALGSNYENRVLAKKPVGYWRLGESGGPVAKDSSNRGHSGHYHDILAFHETGAIKGDTNTAIQLDGKRSYIEIPNHKDFSQPTSGKGLTVEVWVRPDALEFEGETDASSVHWLGKGEPNQYEWVLRFYSKTSERPNRISAYLFNRAGGLGAGAYFEDKLTAGEWIHVVACFDPGNAATKDRRGVHIYKNGLQRLSPPSPGVLYNNPQWQIYPEHGNAPLRLGSRDLKSFLTGGLDEVAIYPRVLSEREILENYNVGKGLPI